MNRTARVFTLPITLVLAVLAGCASQPEPRDDAAGVTRHAAAGGSGSVCSVEQPCALADAIARAGEGTVLLAAGDYGDLELGGGSSQAVVRTDQVVIEPLDGAEVVVGKLTLELPATTWRDVTFTGGIYLDTPATGTVLDGIHVDGSGVFVHAANVTIRDSVIENGTSIDGIQIGGARNVTIEHSTIRGFGQGPGSDVHSDCVQIFDSSEVVLRGNYLGNCDNAALIFSPGGDEGISDVLVEANRIQGCVAETERCSGGTAFDLRDVTAITDVVVRNNTMLDGSVMVDPLDGLVFDRNIVDYASNCAMPMTNTIVASWNTGNCDSPDALGRDGNRQGEVRVRDRQSGDLGLVDPQDAAIEPSGAGAPASAGFDGESLPADQAGAGG
ncbi:right-handed parallel beta-helix repeat-containing protein [Pseudolysinimonas sp.]|uniref:right-handed parallel beta-helix repeat-containing protein n=1 Tax=Pseudolysinimonas sp. TaxID=2680009 RepID=UPI00286AEC51|nr:right-handed parallel beta-helix repeat-containing protein [Pseudolysinimonas sp.]